MGTAAVLGLLFLAVSAASDCVFPNLPTSYSAALTVNLILNEREGRDGGGGPRDDLPIKGLSQSFTEVVSQNNMAKIEMYTAIPEGDGEILIMDSIIWNRDLDGAENFLRVADLKYPFHDIACASDYIEENSFFWYMFGFNNDPPRFPSVVAMLHFDPENDEITCGEPTDAKNIAVIPYFVKNEYADLGYLNITYYWSDRELWAGSAGYNRSVPVQATIIGEGKFDPDDPDRVVMVNAFWDFQQFFEAEPDPAEFLPPRDVACERRNMTMTLPMMPNSFHFNSEVIYHFHTPEDMDIHVVAPREEWYDYDQQVSRIDYKPFDFQSGGDPFASKGGFISEVKDFIAGVEYKTSESWGNCTATYVGFDPSGDVSHGDDGSIHMASPFEFWHTDQKYAFNGQFKERSISADFFASETWEGSHHQGEGGRANFTTVMALSAGEYEVEGEEGVQRLVPVKMETYPNQEYNNEHRRIIQNIEGFEGFEPDMTHYDITGCFTDDAMDDRAIRMGWTSEMDVEADIKVFRDQIRLQASTGAQITPLRIQNIDLDVVEEESAFYAIFTMVDTPPGLEMPDEAPPEAKRPLSEAVQFLAEYIRNDNFHIDVPVHNEEGSLMVNTAADTGYFESVDRSLGEEGGGKGGKYTGGAMFGLAVGMIVMMSVLFGALYYFKLRPNAGVRGFDNPLRKY